MRHWRALAGLTSIAAVAGLACTNEFRGAGEAPPAVRELRAWSGRSTITLDWPVQPGLGYHLYLTTAAELSPSTADRRSAVVPPFTLALDTANTWTFAISAFDPEETPGAESALSARVRGRALPPAPFGQRRIVSPPLPLTAFGLSVASGHVDGDGFDDLIVGAPYFYGQAPAPAPSPGRVWLHRGDASGVSTSAAGFVQSGGGNAGFGFDVSAGDFNGDGRDDLLAGAPFAGGAAGFGSVFLGSGGSFVQASFFSRSFAQTNALNGHQVASLGNVDGDAGGTDDIAISAVTFDPTPPADAGRVEVFYGAATAPDTTPDFAANGIAAGEVLGFSPIAGNFLGGPEPELAVGCPQAGTGSGRVAIFENFLAGNTPRNITAGASGFLGYSLAKTDANLDGFDDLLAGAPLHDGPFGENSGRVALYLGTDTGMSLAWTLDGDQTFGQVGFALETIPDLNGDGRRELVAGSVNAPPAVSGRVRLHLSEGDAFASLPSWQAGGVAGDQLSYSMTTGDFDGDGITDLAAAAPQIQVGPGAVHVFRGLPPTSPIVGLAVAAGTDSGTVDATPTFTDPALARTHRCTFDWGDGEQTTILEPCISGTTPSHAYALPGTYTVTLRVQSITPGDDRFAEALVTTTVD